VTRNLAGLHIMEIEVSERASNIDADAVSTQF
jgi:hypothetical protein